MKNQIVLGFIVSLLLAVGDTAVAEIKIGWIGPLTGNAAILGVDTVPAIQIAFDEINRRGGIFGEKLQLVVEDDQYEAAKTVRAYNHLVNNEGIKVLYVLTYGGLFAIAPRAQRDGVLLLDPLDCDEPIAELPSNTMCIAKTTEAIGALLAKQMVARGDAPPAIIYFDGDPFMGTAAQAVIDELKRNGVDPAYVGTYNETTTDFRSMLSKVKVQSTARSLALLGYDQMGLAAKQARELGLKFRFYGVNTVTSPGFLALAGDAAEGVAGSAFRAERTPGFAEFLAEFKKRVGREPQFETSAIPAYDTAQLIARGLRQGGYDRNTRVVAIEQLRNEFLAVQGYSGLSGTITMDPDGITRSIGVRSMILSRGAFLPLGEG